MSPVPIPNKKQVVFLVKKCFWPNVLEIKLLQSSGPLECGTCDNQITIVLTPAYNLFSLQPFSEFKVRPLEPKYCLGQNKFSRERWKKALGAIQPLHPFSVVSHLCCAVEFTPFKFTEQWTEEAWSATSFQSIRPINFTTSS